MESAVEKKLQEADNADAILLTKIRSSDALFDDIIEAIGNNGYFQKRFNLIFNFILVAIMAMPFLNLVIALSIPGHHCHVPGRNVTQYTLEQWQEKMLPKDINPKTNTETISSCKMYVNGTEVTNCLYGFDYDQTWYTQTVPSMQNWVCDQELYVTNTFVASRVGEIIGLFCFGQLGDRIGRKPVFFISLTLLMIGRTLTVLTSHSYHLFTAVVVLGSSAAISIFQTPLVIGLEVSAEDTRAHLAFMQCTGWVIGCCALPMLAWLLGDWQRMILITTLPSSIAFFLYKIMPESPRWLASRGRVKDAVLALNHIAKVNGTTLPDDTYHVLEKIAEKKEKVYGIPSLFANKRLAKNTVVIIVCWVVCSISYYSLVLNVSNMAGNPFVNFFWQSLVELPGYMTARFLSNRVGRRWTHAGSYLVSIAFCAAVILSHGSAAWVTTAFVTCVKMAFTVTFYIVWLQAMEVYPTCIRQTGTSIGGLVANIFGMLGPYIVYLGTNVDGRLPYVLLLCLALLGCICSTLLPETLNKKLPETLEDAKDFGSEQTYWSLNKTTKSRVTTLPS